MGNKGYEKLVPSSRLNEIAVKTIVHYAKMAKNDNSGIFYTEEGQSTVQNPFI